MLPSHYRMRRSEDFSAVLRGGRRCGTDLVVIHALAHNEAGPKVGFIVSKRVGNSVVRHATVRKLRHIMAAVIPELSGYDVVVRALPAAAEASSADLERAIHHAWRTITTRGGRS